MEKSILLLAGALFFVCPLLAQELYVATEPASNMPRNSIGIRLTNEGVFRPGFKNRTIPEVMFGANKNLMLHASAYLSDFYSKGQRFEGYGLYAKYRFLSIDTVQRHFRGAFYVRYSDIKSPVVADEINLEGNNSGLQGGLTFTQLLHKLALSGSVNYTVAFDNGSRYPIPAARADHAIGYTLSAGYLLFPKTYQNYDQPNLNVYAEFLGKSNPAHGQSLMDFAPAVQFIFNSRFRIDLSQRIQLWNNMLRNSKNMYLLRLEYNIFNVI